MGCKHKTKQSRCRENRAVWNTLGGTKSTVMEWSALVIGLFVSCSCCGLQGPEECARQASRWRKRIYYTQYKPCTEPINHYRYTCVTQEYWQTCNAVSSLLLSCLTTRLPRVKKHVKIEIRTSFFTTHSTRNFGLDNQSQPLFRAAVIHSRCRPPLR